jgi:hypothetical protein
MNLELIILTGIIIFFASLLQGTVGFALSLFATPLLVWGGVKLSHAVALISISILIQVLLGAYQLRTDVKWREVISATVIRCATIPFGIMLLAVVASFDPDWIKQILGLILLAVLFLQLYWRVEPRDHLHPGWTLLAFSCSGVMHGLAAMGGPPAVLWVMARRWSNRQTRAFLFSLFMLAAPFQVILLYYSFGQEILWPMLGGLASTPIVAAGSAVGMRLGDSISKNRLRQFAFGLLWVIALSSILAPLWK